MSAQKIQSDNMAEVWNKFLEPSIQRFQVDVAEGELKNAVARRNFGAEAFVITDSVPRRDYHDVKPFGRIEFVSISGSIQAAVQWILAQLLLTAPVGRGPDKRPGHPGFYKGHFLVLQDMIEVTDLTKLQTGHVIHIVNTTVYAAKIEGKDPYTRWRTGSKGAARSRRLRKARGFSAKRMRGESRQAPQGVFNVVFRLAKQRYSRSIDIEYTPMPLPNGAMVMGDVRGSRRGGRRASRRRRQQVYPAIRLFQRPDGGGPS